MNTKITALTLAAATAFAFTAKPAVAGDKELAVIGGLIGGLIIASAINDHGDDNYSHTTVSYRSNNSYNHGYWRNVEVRVWVPGYWVAERDYYGHSHRRYVPGRYDCRNDRVWVAYNSHDRRDDRYDRRDDRRDDRHNRDSGRGHGNDRDSGRDRRDNRR